MGRRIRKRQGTLFGTLTPQGRVVKTSVIDLRKVKSNDPLAFAFGVSQARAGRPFPKERGLAPEFVRGFKLGKKKRKIIGVR